MQVLAISPPLWLVGSSLFPPCSFPISLSGLGKVDNLWIFLYPGQFSDLRFPCFTAHDIIGNAPMESEYRIVGRNEAGDWWKIVFVDNEGKEAHGWLYAPFEKAVNADEVEVAEPPPPFEVLSTNTPEPTLIPAPAFTPGAG